MSTTRTIGMTKGRLTRAGNRTATGTLTSYLCTGILTPRTCTTDTLTESGCAANEVRYCRKQHEKC